GIDGSLDEGETGVPVVEATTVVGIARLDVAEVVAILVDGLMGGGEVVVVADALT
ncbi:hypothetical protein KI387_016257, partial [Taxus chinensis]